MKKITYFLTALFLLMGVNSCTDDFEDINTNPNKLYEVDLEHVFPGTVKRTLDVMGEMNFTKWLNFSRYAYLAYATTPSQDEGDGLFKKTYVDLLRDLEVMDDKYKGKNEYRNRRAIILTWKSYVYYMLASTYGPVPMSDAIVKGTEVKRSYKYDSESKIYEQILDNLAVADTLYDPFTTAKTDLEFADPVFGTGDSKTPDLNKWSKFSNTFRLHIAMHAQNILEPSVLDKHVREAMANESKFISSLEENAAASWGTENERTASYYFNRYKNETSFSNSTRPALSEYFALYLFSYNDPRISKYVLKSNAKGGPNTAAFVYEDTITRPHGPYKSSSKVGNSASAYSNPCTRTTCPYYAMHQADGLNEYRRDSILIEYTMDYVPMIEMIHLPMGWEYQSYSKDFYDDDAAEGAAQRFRGTGNYRNVLGTKDQYNISFVDDQSSFMNESATIVFLSWADACFLRAEATVLLGGDDETARKFYENGVRASFQQYGLTDAEATTYLAQNGIKWNTNGKGFADSRQLYRANINGENNVLEQIHKQHYIADFFNGLEGWNLERRTRALRYPPYFVNGQSSNVIGFNSTYNFWTERMIYPANENTKNRTAYLEGIQLLHKDSPYSDMANRWGDNVYTNLGFSKRNPDLESAKDYIGNRRVVTNCDYFNDKYGSTYEEIVAEAVKRSGIENNDTRALSSGLQYTYKSILKTYYASTPPGMEP